jgi:hypothetical protein
MSDQSGWEPEVILESKPTVSEQVVADALEAITNRSFSGRNPHLGKMVNCAFCGRRHRQVEELKTLTKNEGGELETRVTHWKCEQKFATGRWDVRDPKPLLIAGETPETEAVINKLKIVIGAKAFKGRRLKPHHNHRAMLFIEEVRKLTPDEYTQEDLEKARKRAKRILAKRYGRHGFLPMLGMKQEKKDGTAAPSAEPRT